MFPLPEIQSEFKKYVLVRLFVEEKNHGDLQDKWIKVATLPSYVVLKPGTETVTGFVGYDTNPGTRVSGFQKFLSDQATLAMQ